MSKKQNILTNSRLDYFESPTLQLVNKIPTGLRQHLPVNPIEVNPIHFSIIGNSRETINFSQHFLYVRYNIQNAAGNAALADGYNTHYGTINNCLHSLFKHCNVQINGITVTPSSDFYPIHAYLNTLFSATKENENTLRLQGWHRDTGNVVGMGGGNTGFTQRAALFADGVTREFLAPLDVDIFKCKKNMPPNTRIDIKLYRADNAFTCQHDNHQDGGHGPGNITINLQKCELYLRHELHLDSVLNAIQKTCLNGYNYKLPYKIMTIKSDIIQPGQTSFTRDDICLGMSPLAAAITFAPAANFNGTYATTPYHFDGGNTLTGAYLSVNGRKLAFDNPLNLDLQHHDFYRGYHSLLMFAGAHNWFNPGLIFTPDEYITGNFMMGCTNIRDLDGEGVAIEPPEPGTTKIQINWANPGPEVLTQLLMILIFHVTTEITSTGQVLHPFNL